MAEAAAAVTGARGAVRGLLGQGLLPLVLLATIAGFALAAPAFATPDNAINILIQASYPAIFATAQMFVLLTRGFDLSLGVTVSMVSVLGGSVMAAIGAGSPDLVPMALLVGALVGLACGTAVGVANGAAVAYLGVNPFVATLGMWNIVLGIATTASGGKQIFDIPAELNRWFYRDAWLGVPVPVVMALLLVLLAWAILTRTVLGRALYLIGGNPRAAAVAGLPSRACTLAAYALCSFYVAIGALMLTARTGSGEPNLGGALTLESIAAAVIGGVSLRGGEGAVTAPLLGAVFVTVLSNGMNLMRVDGYVQQMILGAVVIGAVFLDRLRRQARD